MKLAGGDLAMGKPRMKSNVGCFFKIDVELQRYERDSNEAADLHYKVQHGLVCVDGLIWKQEVNAWSVDLIGVCMHDVQLIKVLLAKLEGPVP